MYRTCDRHIAQREREMLTLALMKRTGDTLKTACYYLGGPGKALTRALYKT
jgi:hypothetical protein